MSWPRRLTGALSDPRMRRRGYGVLALVLLVLCFFPQPYVARTKFVPQDPSSLGIGSMTSAFGSQFQGFAALLGGAKQPIDMYLAIARSTEVTDAVIARLRLVGPQGYGDERAARIALARKVDIHSLTGGIIEVEARTHDGGEAERLARAYAGAISDRIINLGDDRTRRKRGIVEHRFAEASDRVAKAEAALDGFRRRNNLAAPEAQLGSELSLRANLQAQLQAKKVELQTMSGFLGPENPKLRAMQSEIASLQQQIARTATPGSDAAGPNVAGLSQVSGEYLDLYRDYRFAQALYEVYARSSEEVAVEALAGETASDVQVIEAARLDADRKLNIAAVAVLVLVLLLAAFTELYAPATGLRLPLIGGRPMRGAPAREEATR
ncbi:capsule biosynthesis protein [Novosphingobium album (ex Liu et al. 2023)]|uniref:Capsule biosynthesis protein n=1 Tax=Novosphingobium album (ex Liu et al. 2023) TaxID=3031130 RepID=A0ABT5WQM7_9SPHN|nr:capsule biosynthesis protein [Novosphingobium album (ex Liu et al. 2023)]MDE8652343.1 capsule biosynthesis protein [Novosphingobium album (ex Liu et al. 2023)]